MPANTWNTYLCISLSLSLSLYIYMSRYSIYSPNELPCTAVLVSAQVPLQKLDLTAGQWVAYVAIAHLPQPIDIWLHAWAISHGGLPWSDGIFHGISHGIFHGSSHGISPGISHAMTQLGLRAGRLDPMEAQLGSALTGSFQLGLKGSGSA